MNVRCFCNKIELVFLGVWAQAPPLHQYPSLLLNSSKETKPLTIEHNFTLIHTIGGREAPWGTILAKDTKPFFYYLKNLQMCSEQGLCSFLTHNGMLTFFSNPRAGEVPSVLEVFNQDLIPSARWILQQNRRHCLQDVLWAKHNIRHHNGQIGITVNAS